MSAAYTLVTAESAKSEKVKTMRRNNLLLIYTISKVIPSMGNFSIQYNFQAIAVSLMVMSVKQCTSTETECMEGKQAHWVAGGSNCHCVRGRYAGATDGELPADKFAYSKKCQFHRMLYIAPHRWAT